MSLPGITTPPGTPAFLASGHGITESGPFGGFEPASGHSRRRRVYTVPTRVASVEWFLDSVDIVAVESWYENDLQAGALEFSAQVRNQGEGAALLWWRARWMEPPTYQMINGGRARFSGRLFLTGEGTETPPQLGLMSAEFSLKLRDVRSAVSLPTTLAAEFRVPLTTGSGVVLMAAEFNVSLETGAPVFVGVLDPYTSGLWGAYGIMRLLSSYTGPLLRVRRAADNTERDIAFLSGGSLDTTDLLAFIGSDSAFVVTLYDQSGGGNDLGVSASSWEPRIVNAGVYDGFVRFDGAAHHFSTGTSSGTPAAFTVAGKLQWRSTSGVYILTEHSPDQNAYEGCAAYVDGTNLAVVMHELDSGGGFTEAKYSLPSTAAPHVYASRWDRSISSPRTDQNAFFVDGTIQTHSSDNNTGTQPTGNFSTHDWNVGARFGGSYYAPVNLYNWVIYEAAKSDTDVNDISGALL